MKKIISFVSLILVIGMIAASLIGCGNNPDKPDDNADLKGTYTITVWCAENLVNLTTKQLERFNATNDKGIFLDFTVNACGEDVAATNMITDVEAGADLFCFAQDQAARLINAGALSKLGKAAAAKVVAENAEGVCNAGKAGDDYYAYPLTADNGYFLYYDKSVITDEDAKTLEGIIAACEKANKYFSFSVEGSAFFGASFFFGTDCKSEWTIDSKGKYTGLSDDFSSDKGFIAAKGMKKLLDSKCYNNSSAAADFGAAIPSAAVVSGTWDYTVAKDILGDNLGAVKLPTFTVDGKTYQIGSFNGCKLMGVKPQTDAKKSAVCHLVAQFLTSEDAQLERFNEVSWGPANLNAQKDEAVMANPGLAALLAQAPYSVPQGQIHGSWWDIFSALAAAVKNAKTDDDIKAALATYKASVEGLLSIPTDIAEAFTVIGSICGTNWDTDFEMDQKPDGTWWSAALELKKGDELKVRQGKGWDVNFPADNIKIEEDGYYFVKLVFDKDTKSGTVTLEKNSPITGWTVIGSINGDGWTIDLPMEIQADGTFKTTEAYTMDAGVEFKVRQGCSWDVSWGDGTNNFKVETAGTYYVVFDPITSVVSIVK